MPTWAITPNGVGEPVGFRAVRPGWDLASGETFTVEQADAPDGYVLAADGVSIEPGPPAEPAPTLLPHYAYARFGWTSGTGLLVKDLSENIGGVTRVATGRYRVNDIAPDGVELVLRAVTPRDASTTPIEAHATAATASYVEFRCFRWNGTTFAAVDPVEIVVEIDKVVLQ